MYKRIKSYICIDCDLREHHRFQDTPDVTASVGAFATCLMHSRAQEQDGLLRRIWLERTFDKEFERIEHLIRVGVLIPSGDRDYEIRSYAPRNQTRAMLDEARAKARGRQNSSRAKRTVSLTLPTAVTRDMHVTDASDLPSPSSSEESVTRDIRVSHASFPSSSSSSLSSSSSSFLSPDDPCHPERSEGPHGENGGILRASGPQDDRGADIVPVDRGPPDGRRPLPPSERAVSGSYWLAAFTKGIAKQTGRPCTAGRMYVTTLERIVAHHAPKRDAPSACHWLTEQAAAFAEMWDGERPPKGLTPDGLERWLNEGRRGPPQFGKKRVVQLPAEEWKPDDWSDMDVEVIR